MKKTTLRRLAAIFVLGALFSAIAAPAMSLERGTVPSHAIVGSVDLYGMTEVDARAAISAEASLTSLPKLKVMAAKRIFTFDPRTALTLNVTAMLDKAYAASADTTVTITRTCTTSPAVVAAFVSKVAKSVYRPSRNAAYYMSKSNLRWRTAITQRKLQTNPAKAAITKAILAEAASGKARPTVPLWSSFTAPKVTNAKLGRAILVDLSQRRLWLKDHSRIVTTYRIAIGMPGHETPRGVFTIIAKAKNPAWRNPGSAWADSMASYIAPGPTNPLGTRALYLNSPGIRIHGTSKTWTIGTAASHGCMRVANRNVEKLYPLVPVGTKVFIIK